MATPRRIISRSDFARLLGVGRSAVSKACRPGKRLHPACAKGGVDELHTAAQAWLAERRPPLPPKPRPLPADVAPEDEPIVGDLGELGRLTLNDLNEQHGNVRELRGFIRARRD